MPNVTIIEKGQRKQRQPKKHKKQRQQVVVSMPVHHKNSRLLTAPGYKNKSNWDSINQLNNQMSSRHPRYQELRTKVRGPKDSGFARSFSKLSLSNEMKNIVLSLSMPSDSEPIRLPVGVAVPTVVSKPFANLNIDFSIANTNTSNTPTGAGFAAISRDPFHAYIHQIKAPGAWTQAVYFDSYSVGISQTCGLPTRVVTESESRFPLPIVYTKVTAPATLISACLDPCHYAHNDLGLSAVWVNANSGNNATFTLTGNANFAVSDCLNVYGWDRGVWILLISQACTVSTTVAVAMSVPNYYAFELVMQSASASVSTVTAQITGLTDFYAIEPIPGFTGKSNMLTSARVNSAAILFSERSPQMYEGGMISAVQLPTNHFWYESCALNTVQTSAGNYTGDLKKGLYGFHRPSSANDYDMEGRFTSVNGSVTAFQLPPIQPPGGWLIVSATVPAVAGVYPGGLANVVCFWHLEYTTLDTWVQRSESNLSTFAFLEAMDQLRYLPQFHENPLHWSDIARFVSNIGKTALKVGPGLLTAISSVFPAAAPYARVANAVASVL